MNKKRNFLIMLGVLVVLIAGASVLYGVLGEKYDANAVSETQQKGEADADVKKTLAPDFSVTDFNGKDVKLSNFTGKPAVVNFWASWCGPCRNEMADFDLAYMEYKDEINFLMVNLTDGQRETIKIATEYVESEGYSFPVYFDAKSDAAATYSVYSVPTTYFIDKEGYLVAHAKGAIDLETLKRGINMISSDE